MRTLHYNQLNVQGGAVERLRDDRGDVQRVRSGRCAAQHLPRRAAGQLRQRPAGEGPRRATRSCSRSTSATRRRRRRTRGRASTSSPRSRASPNGNSEPNNFPFFRLAEMYLIKAEALNELGPDRGRDRAGQHRSCAAVQRRRSRSSTGLSQAAARTAIFNERLFELAGEGKRRSDMIRAGTFIDARRFKRRDAGRTRSCSRFRRRRSAPTRC